MSDLPSYGEPGAIVYRADCVRLMRLMPADCVDAIFADPPYRLSGGGVTVKSGKVRSVNKGEWDRPRGFAADHEFNVRWLSEARRVLKPDGTLWVTGTHHIIFSLGYALQSLGFRVLNHVVWEKADAPPNALHTSFKHAHATQDNRDGGLPRHALAGGRGERGGGGVRLCRRPGRELINLALANLVLVVLLRQTCSYSLRRLAEARLKEIHETVYLFRSRTSHNMQIISGDA